MIWWIKSLSAPNRTHSYSWVTLDNSILHNTGCNESLISFKCQLETVTMLRYQKLLLFITNLLLKTGTNTDQRSVSVKICIIVLAATVQVSPKPSSVFVSTFNIIKGIWPGPVSVCVCVCIMCDISYIAALSWLTCDQKRFTHPEKTFHSDFKGSSGCLSVTQDA